MSPIQVSARMVLPPVSRVLQLRAGRSTIASTPPRLQRSILILTSQPTTQNSVAPLARIVIDR